MEWALDPWFYPSTPLKSMVHEIKKMVKERVIIQERTIIEEKPIIQEKVTIHLFIF
jgi:hypothetical protein